jgi:ATP-dependent protease HslVU (ClpYQ) peptidase subunit
MSTIVVVRKNGTAVIAADTLTTCGNTKESADYVVNHEKILSYQGSYLGITGSASLQIAVHDFLGRRKKRASLTSIADIFRFGLQLHRDLKEEYFLRADDEEDFETFRGDILIANRTGIYGLSSYRYVQEYTRFYANGSGAEYALGAMFASYGEDKTALEIAELGARAGAEFDDGSALPITSHSIKLAKNA